MSRSVSRTRVVLAASAAATALALAACSAGQITQTSTQQSGVDGASANIGQIAVRGAELPYAGDGKSAVVYASGGSAPLSMTVANFGAQADKLTGASSPVAGSVKISGDATISAGKLLQVQGTAGSAPVSEIATTPIGQRPDQGETVGPSEAVSANPAPPATSAAPATAGVGTNAPSNTSANAAGTATATENNLSASQTPSLAATPTPSPQGTTTAQVTLTGLKQDIKAGLTYPVVLTFQQAGDVTVQVPVGNPPEGSSNG